MLSLRTSSLALRGHQSGLQGMWVKKLGRALRPKPEIAPKGLLTALSGPHLPPLTPPGISLSATFCSNAFVACKTQLPDFSKRNTHFCHSQLLDVQTTQMSCEAAVCQELKHFICELYL